MVNLERDYIHIPLLQSRAKVLLEQINTELRTNIKDDIVSSFYYRFLPIIKNSLFSPLFENKPPAYLSQTYTQEHKEFVDSLRKDITSLLQEYEILEPRLTGEFNKTETRLAEIARLTRKLFHLLEYTEHYFYDAKSSYFWVIDSFTNDDLIEQNSSFLSSAGCHLNRQEGIITNPIVKNGSQRIPISKLVINDGSDGTPGNSIIKIPESCSNIESATDSSPVTWFEYEKVRETYTDGDFLTLDLTATFSKIQVVNNLLIEFVNKPTQNKIEVVSLKSSLEGSVWDEIPFYEESFIVGGSKDSVEAVSITMLPREARFVTIQLRQTTPNKVKKLASFLYRYFIAIKNLSLNAIEYQSVGEIVTPEITSPQGFNYVSLVVDKQPSFANPAFDVQYFVMTDNYPKWVQLYSSSDSDEPKTIEFNTDSKTAIKVQGTPRTIRFKTRLIRDDKQFNQYFYTDTKTLILDSVTQTSSEFQEYKAIPDAVPGTIVPAIVDSGSTGNTSEYTVGFSSGAPSQEFILPFENVQNVVIKVSGHEWSRVIGFSSSSSTDTHYTYSERTKTLVFGNGTNGSIPVGKITAVLPPERLQLSETAPHLAELTFYSDGDKSNVNITTVSDFKIVKNLSLGKRLKEIQLPNQNIYSYTKVEEEVPKGTRQFVIKQPVFVDDSIVFSDKVVFNNKTETLEKTGDFSLVIDPVSRLCTVSTYSSTSTLDAGIVSYNSNGSLVPARISNTRPYDKVAFTTGLSSKYTIYTNATIYEGDLLKLTGQKDDELVTLYATANSSVSGTVSLSNRLEGILLDSTATRTLQKLTIKKLGPEFSNRNVFKTEKLFVDGRTELQQAGDYSLDYAEGKVFSFSETYADGSDKITYRYQDVTEISDKNWDFYYGDSVIPKHVVIDEAAYSASPKNSPFVVDSQKYAYIKPGRGCSQTDYTRVKYNDLFYEDPFSVRSIFCGSPAMEDEYSPPTNQFPIPYYSTINWRTAPLPLNPAVSCAIQTNKQVYGYGDTQIVQIDAINNSGRFKGDFIIDIEEPGGRFVRLVESRDVFLPAGYVLEGLSVVNETITTHLQPGTYTVWFGVFSADGDLVSNIASSSFVYQAQLSYRGSTASYAERAESGRAVFVPYYDLERGDFLTANSKMQILSAKNITKGSVKFMGVNSTQICRLSMDFGATHFCKYGIQTDDSEDNGRYYRHFCTNTSCPMYKNINNYNVDLFTTEVDFINGADEFEDTEPAWSLDYQNGNFYTNFSIPENVIISYATNSFLISYNIVTPLAQKDFATSGNKLKIKNRQVLTANTPISIFYKRNSSSQAGIGKLKPYFTPILRSYKLRLGRISNE